MFIRFFFQSAARVPRGARALVDRLALRRTRRTERHAIAALPENVVGRIAGTVERFEDGQLVAPLSQRPCVFYEIVVEEHLVYEGTLRTLAREQRGVPFTLVEAGHHAIVDPDRADAWLEFDHSTDCKGSFDAPAAERETLDRLSLLKRNWFLTEGLRFREAIVEVGDRIAVVGAGTREADPDGRIAVDAPLGQLYREAPPTRLRITPVTITDDPEACR